MNVPWQRLAPETLRALIEEFITREGTDYGRQERSFEAKIADVQRLLERGHAKIVFDAETQSCDIREVRSGSPRVTSDPSDSDQAPRPSSAP